MTPLVPKTLGFPLEAPSKNKAAETEHINFSFKASSIPQNFQCKDLDGFRNCNLFPETIEAEPILDGAKREADGAEREAVEQPVDSVNHFLEICTAS